MLRSYSTQERIPQPLSRLPDFASSINLAKLPFELGFRVQRERLKPSYGDGFHGAPLVIWPASGDKLPEKGGADAPARQDSKAVIDPGEP
jgi:hypothetical protein